jgi:hypothetical protein
MVPKQSLVSMSVEALFTLRDEVAKVLSKKAKDLQRQLDQLARIMHDGGELKTAVARNERFT